MQPVIAFEHEIVDSAFTKADIWTRESGGTWTMLWTVTGAKVMHLFSLPENESFLHWAHLLHGSQPPGDPEIGFWYSGDGGDTTVGPINFGPLETNAALAVRARINPNGSLYSASRYGTDTMANMWRSTDLAASWTGLSPSLNPGSNFPAPWNYNDTNYVWWGEKPASGSSSFAALRRANLDGSNVQTWHLDDYGFNPDVSTLLITGSRAAPNTILVTGPSTLETGSSSGLYVVDNTNPAAVGITERILPLRTVNDAMYSHIPLSNTKLVVVLGYDAPEPGRSPYALVSEDSGASWTDVTIDATVYPGAFGDWDPLLVYDYENPLDLWLPSPGTETGYPAKLFHSIDGGATWEVEVPAEIAALGPIRYSYIAMIGKGFPGLARLPAANPDVPVWLRSSFG
jgi:hypothetical protein